ncbi:MAG: hypothetical protein ACW99L_08090, partial [Promethearchaeota archaeon]
TSWRIQLKSRNENIEITSVEISGEVRIIKLALIKNDKSVKVEMKKEEFYNFLSLISAFKDVVIGEETGLIDDTTTMDKIESQERDDVSYIRDDAYPFNQEPTEKNYEDKNNEELNPEEWDPW